MEKGKMIINGVEVGGSSGSATSIPYSNTNSGLEATNVQGAIDELNSNLGNIRFGVDGDGNYGYYGADGSLIPFKSCELIFSDVKATKGGATCDCTGINGYENLSANNFLCVLKSIFLEAYQFTKDGTKYSLTKTYDNATGTLTIKSGTSVSNSVTLLSYVDVYLVR